MEAHTADAHTRTDTRFISNLLLIGAALAVLGNALHPFFAGDATAEAIIAEATTNAIWVPVHLGLGIAIAVLTAALVMLAGYLRRTAGAGWATVAATTAVIGGAIWVIQLTGIDGVVLPTLGEGGLSGAELAAVEAMVALDQALLSLSVFLYLGGTFLALGAALDHADAFAPWIRWTATLGGATGVVVGVMMLLDVAAAFTFIAFRIVAFATTVVAIGLALELRNAREPAGAPATAPST